MIQFNLLPDVKTEYLKAQRTKRFVLFMATAIGATAFTIFAVLFVNVQVLQKQHIGNVNEDIIKDTERLRSITDLEKIITVQNQLNSLPGLHEKKPVSTRLFTYLTQVVPDKITISKLEVDFETSTMHFEGSADALSTVNQFIDTLKFTKFAVTQAEGSDENAETPSAFSEVVLTSFGRTDKEATYQVDFKFDPVIFDGTQTVSLVVPQIVTTRSTTERPVILFQEQELEEQR